MKKDFRRTAAIAAAALVIGSMLYAAPGDFIERERAMDIALRDSGLEASSVSFVRSHLDRDDGRMVYDVEFYSGNTEYDYEIDALTGEILAKDRDAEYWNSQGYTDALIEDSRAVSIALEDAGVADPGRIRAHLDRDDGRLVYEVEFRTADGEYEYRIDAVDGMVLEASAEKWKAPIHHGPHHAVPGRGPAAAGPGPAVPPPAPAFGIEEAAAAALQRVPGADRSMMRIHEDWDDGRRVFEGEIRFDGFEYDFEIDEYGRFLDWDRDRDDWF